MVAAALSGQTCVVLEQIELSQALDCDGLAVLRDAWQRFRSEKRFADMPQIRQRRPFADQCSEQSQQAGR